MKALLAELRGPADDESMAAYARRNGLARALRRHCDLAAPEGVDIDIDVNENVRLNGDWNETLLRIAQEALANAFRHGSAKSIWISLAAEGSEHAFRIENDGRGLNAARPNCGSTHIGLDSMRARAAAAGGKLAMRERAEGGVCVEVRFPLTVKTEPVS